MSAAAPIYAAPELDLRITNDAFSIYVRPLSDAAKVALQDFLPDRERERDGRLFLGGFVALDEFQTWARARGLQMATDFRE